MDLLTVSKPFSYLFLCGTSLSTETSTRPTILVEICVDKWLCCCMQVVGRVSVYFAMHFMGWIPCTRIDQEKCALCPTEHLTIQADAHFYLERILLFWQFSSFCSNRDKAIGSLIFRKYWNLLFSVHLFELSWRFIKKAKESLETLMLH